MTLAYNRDLLLRQLRSCAAVDEHPSGPLSSHELQSLYQQAAASAVTLRLGDGDEEVASVSSNDSSEDDTLDGHQLDHPLDRDAAGSKFFVGSVSDATDDSHSVVASGLSESSDTVSPSAESLHPFLDEDSDLEERLMMITEGLSEWNDAEKRKSQQSVKSMGTLEIDFKRQEIHPGPHTSALSTLIGSTSSDDPMAQFARAAGTADIGLKLRVWCRGEPLQLCVRKDASVHQVIGYVLHLRKKTESPNAFNMRLVEDDGEVDDDFPALERLRPIGSYSVDEVALVDASPAERAKNEGQTPFQQAPAARDRTDVVTRVYMFPFDQILSKVYWTDTLSPSVPVETVLSRVCEAKNLDQDGYVLRLASSRAVPALGATLASLHPRALSQPDVNRNELVLMLELVPNRAMQDETTRSPTKPRVVDSGHSVTSEGSLTPGVPSMPTILFQKLGYYKYRVWRRQQVAFLGRQERELAIDGEYVYIMPPSDRSLLEQPKTTTFHIRQVIKCKQSSKVATYLKIFVMKQTGPKRYDIDCVNASDCLEIVERINRLRSKYYANGRA